MFVHVLGPGRAAPKLEPPGSGHPCAIGRDINFTPRRLFHRYDSKTSNLKRDFTRERQLVAFFIHDKKGQKREALRTVALFVADRQKRSPRGHGSNAGHSFGAARVERPKGDAPRSEAGAPGPRRLVASSTPATPLLASAKIRELNHARALKGATMKGAPRCHGFVSPFQGWDVGGQRLPRRCPGPVFRPLRGECSKAVSWAFMYSSFILHPFRAFSTARAGARRAPG